MSEDDVAVAMKPYVIAIAGPSCSGKTSVAKSLAAELPATIFSLDAYYHDLSQLSFSERAAFNFDHPDSLEVEILSRDLHLLAQGREVVRPVYDFHTHTRSGKTETLNPSPYLIVEGLFTLYWESIREIYSTKVFMEADHETCLPRREARDIAERGRSPESIHQQYAATVRPMADQFVMPTRQYADLILSGSQPVEESAAAVLAHVRSVERSSNRR
ncbi:MAG TPA: uridine kinase [Terriglobales bacterium]|nr:uridine kinase [Terriglobales bacterium]